MSRDDERAGESAEAAEGAAAPESAEASAAAKAAAGERAAGAQGAGADDNPAAPAAAGAAASPEEAYRARRPGGAVAVAWLAVALALLAAALAVWGLLDSQRRLASLQARLSGVEAVSGRDSSTLDQLSGALERRLELEVEAAATTLRGERQAAIAALRNRVAELAAATRTARETQATGGRARAALRKELEDATERLEAQLARQRAQLQDLRQLSSADRESWLLAEANYLLRLANQRLVMTGDTASAVALLRSADGVLRELDDPALRSVREAIAKDLAAVRAVPTLDREGAYLQLASLIDRIDDLDAFEPPSFETAGPAASGGGDWQARLRQGYRRALDKLSSYVTVRRRDRPAAVLMEPQWERLVRQNLRLLLEQAQLALLAGNERLYAQSLDSATGWVEEFRAGDRERVDAMLAAIAELAEARVRVEVPDATASLDALRTLLRARDERAAAGAA